MSRNHMTIPNNWYENFFHGVPLDLWRKAISPEHTKREADFLETALQCDQGDHLLDVPCGNGRLSFELAKRGYRVTGVDISEEFIAEARAIVLDPPADAGGTDLNASVDRKPSGDISASADFNPRVEFLLGNMSRLAGEAIYDGAYCFGNSFGFLEYSEMASFLSGVARALKPGARFILETGMAAESAIGKFTIEESHQIEDILPRCKNVIDINALIRTYLKAMKFYTIEHGDSFTVR